MAANAVEIERLIVRFFGDASQLERTIKQVETTAQGMADRVSGAMKRVGGALTAAVTLPVAAAGVAGVKVFADYEQSLANLKAAANPTIAEMVQLKSAIEQLSQATGTMPGKTAAAFTELLKAGFSVEQILEGAGEAAVKFARVGGINTEAAVGAMADAMTVFRKDGLSAAQATDILSRAADASQISIEQVVLALSQASAVAGLANQSLHDTAAAISVMGASGVKGSDAGTSLKTMLLRLMAPLPEAAEMMAKLGLNVRDAQGNMLPLPEIIARMEKAFAGMDAGARDAALKQIFGQDAIRAAAILLQRGTEGWEQFTGKMREAQTVAEKFTTITDTLWGTIDKIKVAFTLAANAVGEMLAPVLKAVAPVVQQSLEWFTGLSPAVKTAAVVLSGLAASIGPILVGLGVLAPGVLAVKAVLASIGAVVGVGILPVIAAFALLAAGAVAVGVAVFALIQRAGGFGAVWEKVKPKLLETWDLLKRFVNETLPLLKQGWNTLKEVMFTAWTEGLAAAKEMFRVIGDVAGRIFEAFGVENPLASLQSGLLGVRDGILTALIAVEFFAKNFDRFLDVGLMSLELFKLEAKTSFINLFTVDLVKALVDFQMSWIKWLGSLASNAATVIGRIMRGNFKGALEGLETFLAPAPAADTSRQRAAELREQIDSQLRGLGADFTRFRDQRFTEAGVGPTADFLGATGAQLDAALSAAKNPSRRQDEVRPWTAALRAGTAVGGGRGKQDEQIDVLKLIRDGIDSLVKKPSAEIDVANLGG